MSDSRFNRVKKNTDFVQDVNSDTKAVVSETITTKNNRATLTIAPNTLSVKERSRVKHGRTLTIPLYVEEIELIERAAEKLSQVDTSTTNFMRQALLDKCLAVLGESEYNSINDVKRNVIKGNK